MRSRAASLGAFRGLRLEFPCTDEGTDLARVVVPRTVDVIRALIGEIEALTATGDPPGQHPDLELVVQLRAAEARRAELRTWSAAAEPARLTLTAANGSLTLEFDPRLQQPARLIRRTPNHGEEQQDLEPWDPHEAIFEVLTDDHAHGEAAPIRRRQTCTMRREPWSWPRRPYPQPASRTHGRFALRTDQRGIHIQVGDDLDRLHDPGGRPLRRHVRAGRSAAWLPLDDLHRVSRSTGPGDLHGLAIATIRRAEARCQEQGLPRNSAKRPDNEGAGV